jgi:hypothetical protein
MAVYVGANFFLALRYKQTFIYLLPSSAQDPAKLG